jgi:hypothetical protein
MGALCCGLSIHVHRSCRLSRPLSCPTTNLQKKVQHQFARNNHSNYKIVFFPLYLIVLSFCWSKLAEQQIRILEPCVEYLLYVYYIPWQGNKISNWFSGWPQYESIVDLFWNILRSLSSTYKTTCQLVLATLLFGTYQVNRQRQLASGLHAYIQLKNEPLLCNSSTTTKICSNQFLAFIYREKKA